MSICFEGRLMNMSEFLQKNHDGIMKQKTGIPDTLGEISNEDIMPLIDRRMVLLTGAGDSYAVAQYGQWALANARCVAVAVSPPEIERYSLDKDCLVIGITASGRSVSTINALKHAQDEGAQTLILTDNPKSESIHIADFKWITKSGVDTFDIAPTAPTTAAMAYLLQTAALMLALPNEGICKDCRTLQKKMPKIIDWAVAEGKIIADFIDVDNALYLISEGPNYVAAHIGMMKFNEFSLQRTIVSLREEFQHHFNLSLQEGNRAVLVADSPTTESDEKYMSILNEPLEVPSYLLSAPESPNLLSSSAQAIANTIALQVAAYQLALAHNPDMGWFKLPNAKAFRIY
ncbi:SIS domain-containing protein [Candidatus Thorarchaeota archaeon]|nr:MAG: SIS domain-containing protein [Candidatus Thorarchaeota archaeon]